MTLAGLRIRKSSNSAPNTIWVQSFPREGGLSYCEGFYGYVLHCCYMLRLLILKPVWQFWTIRAEGTAEKCEACRGCWFVWPPPNANCPLFAPTRTLDIFISHYFSEHHVGTEKKDTCEKVSFNHQQTNTNVTGDLSFPNTTRSRYIFLCFSSISFNTKFVKYWILTTRSDSEGIQCSNIQCVSFFE